MQQSEAFHRELRAAYTAIVADSFARARHCLSLARLARKSGDCAEVRKWLWSVRVLRIAAAEWRKRAQRIAPVLVCLLWLIGCATTPVEPVRVAETVSLPHALVSDACEEGSAPNPLVLFEHAEVLYSGDVPLGLDCSLYDFGIADHRRTLVDFRRSTFAVNRIREYLMSNGVPVPERLLAGGI